MNTALFSKLFFVLGVLIVLGAAVPIPSYQGTVMCKPDGECPKPGWRFQPSLAQQFLAQRSYETQVRRQAVDASIPPSGEPITLADEIRFQGTITGVNQGCFVDATCSYQVDGIDVVVVEGMVMNPNPHQGQVVGLELDEKYIGKKVEVYAKSLGDNKLSIFGKDEYYIKALD